MNELILAIDQGTTGTTVIVLDRRLNIRAQAYAAFSQIYPKPGWVEQRPDDIWRSVCDGLQKVLAVDGVSASAIAAVGITNQRETALMWHPRSGKPYYNAIGWQCRRTADICRSLQEKGLEDSFREKTGLLLDPYFAGTKFKWMLDNVDGLRSAADNKEVQAGTVDTYLVWKLTGGRRHLTDATNASRTLLMDLRTLAWDTALCDLLNIPMAVLPGIQACDATFGHTRRVPGLPDGIPVCGIAGDQQSALFGQACFEEGQAKCTFGTGAFLLMNTGAAPVASASRLLTTVAWKIDDQVTYALEGSAFVAGAAVQWLRDGLKIIPRAADVEALAAEVEDSGGVVMVPGFAGLGAPHWRSDARALLTGITLGTGRAHIARAVLEGIALQNVEILRAMEKDSQRQLVQLKVDGGASANNLLMQRQADFLGCRIVRPDMIETTALGAAFLAGLGAGVFGGCEDIRRRWKKDRTFDPLIDDARRADILARWRAAVAKA